MDPWQTPTLKKTVIQANANVALLQPSRTRRLTIGCASRRWRQGHLFLPVKLRPITSASSGQAAEYQRDAHAQGDGWWLTLTYDEEVPIQTKPAPVVGVDVGIANFLTTSTGKHYGTFHGKLRSGRSATGRSAVARPNCARV